MEPVITLNLPAPLVWGTVTLAGLMIASALVYLTLPKDDGATGILSLRKRMGLDNLHPSLFIAALVLYSGIALLLVIGLLVLMLRTIALPFDPDMALKDKRTEYLFYVLRIAGLTTVLGAVIALPFTIIRLRLTQRQTDTATEALFNDKMTAATTDLYARRQTRDGGWEDDVPRRNSAIDRLEGLVSERPDEAPRVARLLSVYVRELSGPDEVPAKRHAYLDAHALMYPQDDSPPMTEDEVCAHLDVTPDAISLDALEHWARGLTARSDMENAVQTLGRLRGKDGVVADDITIDLRGANLQGIDVESGNFDKARLSGAQLQGAHLSGAQLQGAYLIEAQLQGAYLGFAELQGADLSRAQLQGAHLSGAQLQGADLGFAELQGADLSRAQLQGAYLIEAQLQGAHLFRAQLQGAYLFRAEFDAATSLSAATLRGAALKDVDFSTVPHSKDQIRDMFGDASITLPNGVTPEHDDWPPHWAREEFDFEDFFTRWRAFQSTLPEGWDKDIPKR